MRAPCESAHPSSAIAASGSDSVMYGAAKMRPFLEADNVLAWYLGNNLDASRFTEVAQFARQIQYGDSQRLVMADVWDGYRGYSTSIDNCMIGTHRWLSTCRMAAARSLHVITPSMSFPSGLRAV